MYTTAVYILSVLEPALAIDRLACIANDIIIHKMVQVHGYTYEVYSNKNFSAAVDPSLDH